jgi:hypothetical protein
LWLLLVLVLVLVLLVPGVLGGRGVALLRWLPARVITAGKHG